MRIGVLVLLAALSPDRQSFPLPKEAVIRMAERYGPAPESVDAQTCKNFYITPAVIQYRFRTYHVTSGEELHAYYNWLGCGIQGSVQVNGKIFWWKAEPFSLLQTNYPDGQYKVLGGKHTADPKDGG